MRFAFKARAVRRAFMVRFKLICLSPRALRRAFGSAVLAPLAIVSPVPAMADGADDRMACLAELRRDFEASQKAQDARARARYGQGVRETMASRLYLPSDAADPWRARAPGGPGRGKAALLVHGFIASPYDMDELGARLAADGYVAYAPLLEGFGVDGGYANLHGPDDWRATFAEGMDLLMRCHQDVAVAGHSLGGALTIDFLFGAAGLDGSYVSAAHPERRARISSATLLSPFVRSHRATPGALTFLEIAASHMPTIPIAWLIPFGGRDLRASILFPAFHLSEIPMVALTKVLAFGRSIEALDQSGAVSQVPASLAYGLADETVDGARADRFVAERFARSSALALPNVPHQLLAPAINPGWENLIRELAARIENPDGIGARAPSASASAGGVQK